jgi:hypothetical protein
MTPEPTEEDLARFQAALMELLSEPLSPGATRARLRADPAFAPFDDHVATFELRAIEVASELVRKWGRRA